MIRISMGEALIKSRKYIPNRLHMYSYVSAQFVLSKPNWDLLVSIGVNGARGKLFTQNDAMFFCKEISKAIESLAKNTKKN